MPKTSPALLVYKQIWLDRISDLSEYFNHKRHLPDLIKNNTSAVLVEDYALLKKKIEYLIEIMHVDVKDIATFQALSVDFEEIKVCFSTQGKHIVWKVRQFILQ